MEDKAIWPFLELEATTILKLPTILKGHLDVDIFGLICNYKVN